MLLAFSVASMDCPIYWYASANHSIVQCTVGASQGKNLPIIHTLDSFRTSAPQNLSFAKPQISHLDSHENLHPDGGESFNVYGTSFGPSGSNTVSINGIGAAGVNVISSTHLVCTTAAGAGENLPVVVTSQFAGLDWSKQSSNAHTASYRNVDNLVISDVWIDGDVANLVSINGNYLAHAEFMRVDFDSTLDISPQSVVGNTLTFWAPALSQLTRTNLVMVRSGNKAGVLAGIVHYEPPLPERSVLKEIITPLGINVLEMETRGLGSSPTFVARWTNETTSTTYEETLQSCAHETESNAWNCTMPARSLDMPDTLTIGPKAVYSSLSAGDKSNIPGPLWDISAFTGWQQHVEHSGPDTFLYLLREIEFKSNCH